MTGQSNLPKVAQQMSATERKNTTSHNSCIIRSNCSPLDIIFFHIGLSSIALPCTYIWQTRRGNTAEVCGTQVLADTWQSVNSSRGRDLTCPYEPEEMLHLNMINLQTSNAQNTGKLNLNTH